MISCGCGSEDGGVWSVGVKEVTCRTDRICPSCNLNIIADKHRMYRYSMYDYDNMRPASPLFICERCGDLASTLNAAGFCCTLDSVLDDWFEYLEEADPNNPALRKVRG